MENIRFRIITLKSGEIREFHPFKNKKQLKKAMKYIREDCKTWHNFTIGYKINDIIDTVVCQNKVYFGEDCIVERINA